MKRYLKIIVAIGILTVFIISIGAASAADIYVTKKGKDSGKGTKSSPFQSIDKAVKTAKNGDTIYLGPGTYTGAKNRKITITKNLRISALPANIKKGNTIINAGGKNRIFLANRKLTAVGITFTKGREQYGGAISVAKGSLVVNNCKFTSNRATKSGGAVFSQGGSVTIMNSVFISNTANYGGGVFTKKAILTISNSQFNKNTALISGGGVSHFSNRLLLTGTSFTNNKAGTNTYTAGKGYGGGLHTAEGSHAVIDSSRWTSNHGYGGGICNFGTMSIKNSNFINNYSPKNGGGIAVEDDSNITNCIFNLNIAKERGAGIHNSGSTIVRSSTFTNNVAQTNFGGAMDTHAPFKIYDSKIINNKADRGAAITVFRFVGAKEKYYCGSNVLVQNCVIQGNRGIQTGAVIFVSYGSVPDGKSMQNVVFRNNIWDDSIENHPNLIQNLNFVYMQDKYSRITFE